MSTDHPDWLDIVYALAAVFGIAMSGSRTVFILTAVALIGILIIRGAGEKSSPFCNRCRSSCSYCSGNCGGQYGSSGAFCRYILECEYISGKTSLRKGCNSFDTAASVRAWILWLLLYPAVHTDGGILCCQCT